MTVITLTEYQPSERFDGVAWTEARIDGAMAVDGPWVPIETITLDPVDTDPTTPAVRNFTTAQAGGQTWFRVVFLDADDNPEVTDPVPWGRQGFARVQDVEVRVGRELTDQEQGLANYVINTVTGLIVDALGVPGKDWVADLDPPPATLVALCVEKAIGVITNPDNLTSESRTLGDHQVSHTFARGGVGVTVGAGLSLSDAEERAVRWAVFNEDSATVLMGSELDLLPWTWTWGWVFQDELPMGGQTDN